MCVEYRGTNDYKMKKTGSVDKQDDPVRLMSQNYMVYIYKRLVVCCLFYGRPDKYRTSLYLNY